MTATQVQIIKEVVTDPNIQNLTSVKMADKQFTKGNFKSGHAHLMIDSDKIRPLNATLYKLIMEEADAQIDKI